MHYESRKHAVQALRYGWLWHNLVTELTPADDIWATRLADSQWICEEGDRRLSLSDFAAYKPQARYASASTWNGEGPVPGVSRPRNGHYYRRMKTMGERRKAIPIDDEPGPRPSRSANRLPNSWDDHRRMNLRNNNWKRFRKTQWKPEANRVDRDFAKAVRTIMRADPDVIIVGEVRAARQAHRVLKSAGAGHLVIQTMHTPSIVDLMARLAAGGWRIELPNHD